jgi:RNA polymerase sigma factor (sigma-70 family)
MEARVIDDKEMTLEDVFKKYNNLLHKLSWKYQKAAGIRGLDQDDVLSYAKEGLILAYQRFDQSKGLKFMTFLYPYVDNKIKLLLRDFSIGAKFSRTTKDLVVKLNQHKDMDPEEVAEKYGFDKRILEEALIYRRASYQSMDEPIKHDKNDDKMKVQDTIIIENDTSSSIVEDFVKLVGGKLGKIITMKMNDKTQAEIGEAVGTTQVQVSRELLKLQKLWIDYEKGVFPMKLSVEEYNEHRGSGMLDKDIAKKLGVSQPSLSIWKRNNLKESEKTKAVKTIVSVKKRNETNAPKGPKQPVKNELQDVVNTLKRQLEVRDKAIKQQKEEIEHYKTTTVSKEKHSDVYNELRDKDIERVKNFEDLKKMEEAYQKEHAIVINLDAELENVREQLRQAREEVVILGKELEHLRPLMVLYMKEKVSE